MGYRLRKGKKIIKEYPAPSANCYEIAEDIETLRLVIPQNRIFGVQEFLRQNAFTMAIHGAKARLGDGVILELVS